jgi:hypothetical protein
MSQDVEPFLLGGEEELPMTFVVGAIGSDGWVLASDGRATVHGGGRTMRSSYETQKLRYENQIATAIFGDECAQIARDRIVEELKPDPTKLFDGLWQRELKGFADRVWQSERRLQNDGRPNRQKLDPTRQRGVLFAAVGCDRMLVLEIGKDSNITIRLTTCVAGDPGNPARFLIERYYEKQHVDQLAVLATHAIVQSTRFSTWISGLQAVVWHAGESDAAWLDANDYQARSQQLDRDMLAVMTTAMDAQG